VTIQQLGNVMREHPVQSIHHRLVHLGEFPMEREGGEGGREGGKVSDNTTAWECHERTPGPFHTPSPCPTWGISYGKGGRGGREEREEGRREGGEEMRKNKNTSSLPPSLPPSFLTSNLSPPPTVPET